MPTLSGSLIRWMFHVQERQMSRGPRRWRRRLLYSRLHPGRALQPRRHSMMAHLSMRVRPSSHVVTASVR
jgi:hypothetical protein